MSAKNQSDVQVSNSLNENKDSISTVLSQKEEK